MFRIFRKKNPNSAPVMMHEAVSATDCNEVSESGFFSRQWYLNKYSDVARSGIDPVQHYLEHGAGLGYDPGPDFSTRGYLSRYPDVAKAGMNPLLHYIRHGKGEGRRVVAPSDFKEGAGSRPYRNFAEFLRHCLLQPLIESPFEDVDRCCFALMGRIAADLAARARQIPDDEAPLVSVIMPACNRETVIADAIESVLRQSYTRFELIVVDDGSTDGTALVASRCADDPRVRIESSQARRGVSAARNRGLALAGGELIAYLDSDNTWLPDYLAAMAGAFLQMPEIDAAYSGQYIYHPGQPQPVAVRFGSYNKSLLSNNNYIDLNCFMHRRSALERAGGGFCETLKRLVDWDLILRISRSCRMVSVPVLQSNYFQDRVGNTISSTESLEPSLELVAGRMNDFCPAAVSSPLDRHVAVITVNPLDPASLAAALTQPAADILLLHPGFRLEPIAVAALQAAAYASADVAMTIPQQVLPAGHGDSWKHVPYVQDALPCDVSLSFLYGNVEHIGVFHDGERVALNFTPFFCVYIKRDVWNRCGGLDVSDDHSGRIMCEYIRHVLGVKIVYTPAALVRRDVQV